MLALREPPVYPASDVTISYVISNPVTVLTVLFVAYRSYYPLEKTSKEMASINRYLTPLGKVDNRNKKSDALQNALLLISTFVDDRVIEPDESNSNAGLLRIIMLQRLFWRQIRGKIPLSMNCVVRNATYDKEDLFSVPGIMHQIGDYTGRDEYTVAMLTCVIPENVTMESTHRVGVLANSTDLYGWGKAIMPEQHRSRRRTMTICVQSPIRHDDNPLRFAEFIAYHRVVHGIVRFVIYLSKLSEPLRNFLQALKKLIKISIEFITGPHAPELLHRPHIEEALGVDCVLREYSNGKSEFAIVLSTDEFIKTNQSLANLVLEQHCHNSTSCVVLTQPFCSSSVAPSELLTLKMTLHPDIILPPGQNSRVIINLKEALDVGSHMVFSGIDSSKQPILADEDKIMIYNYNNLKDVCNVEQSKLVEDLWMEQYAQELESSVEIRLARNISRRL